MDWFLDNLGAVIGYLGLTGPVTIFAIWHASKQPEELWADIGENKTLWVVFMTAGWFIAGIGFLAALVYLVSIRLQLEKAASARGAGTPIPKSHPV